MKRLSHLVVRSLPLSLLVLALTVLPITGCSAPPEEPVSSPEPGPAVDLHGYRMVDLTYAFDEETIYWPTSPSNFELEELAHGPTEAGFFYSANAFHAPEHGGTHMDAPIHFADARRTVDEIAVDRLVGPAAVIDVSEQAAADPDYRLTVEDVTAWEAEHGQIEMGTIVLLRTGWGERWPDRKSYLGDDTPGDASNLHFPSFGEEAVQMLIADRGVAMIGVDTASIDHGPSTDFPVHQVAAKANIPGLENIAHLDLLPPTGAWVLALPMKIGGGSGGPVRIVGFIPR